MTTQISTSNIQTSTLAVLDGPSVTNIQVTNSSYTVLDDTAVSLTGGYIKITGTNFFSGCSVVIGAASATSVTFVNSTTLNVQVPALVAGTYVVYVINPDGGVAIRVNGLTYSSEPTWVTGSSLTGDSGISVSIQLTATGASTYALQAGSTLPANLTLTSGGLISGTVTVTDETLYNFTVVATDAELQDSPRTFSITITVGDLYWNYVTALISPTLTTLPFNDDASTNNFAVTVVGDTKPSNFGPYTPGYYSNYFDGTGDFLSVPSNSAFTLGTSDHTIEFWMYLAGGQSAYATQWKYSSGSTQQATNDYYFQASSAGGATFNLLLGAGGSWAANISNSASYTAALNTWTHIAITRSGNTFRLFANGTQVGSSATYSGSIAAQSGAMLIGQDGSSNFMTGYISNFRVVVGQALYTSNFTPSTTPLTAITNTSLLTCQSNRVVDNSTNNFTITRNGDTSIKSFIPFTPNSSYSTYGSAYFDGTGDYLSIPDNAAFTLGTSDFTFECWVYPTSITAGNNNLLAQWVSGGLAFIFRYVAAGRPAFSSGATSVVGTTTAVTVNQWNHVAITRTSGTIRLFVNGVLDSTTGTVTSCPDSASQVTIAAYSDGTTEYVTGYISNLRLVNGTSLYTAAFTPPTTPLTAITNTSLLTCQTNQSVSNSVFLDKSTNNFAVTRNGNTTQGTLSPYGSGWSNYFDGTGDVLTIASNAALAFGTGDFTIEMWYNASVAPTASNLCLYNTSTGNFFIQIGNTAFGIGVVGSSENNAFSYTFTAGTWYHIAVSRVGTTVYGFVNGSLISSASNSVNYGQSGATIGGLTSASQLITGYISNLRIVKGTAVYTSAFTPSTTPLQAIANTSLLTCADNRLIDRSPNNFAITRNGDTSVQKFSPFAGTTLPTPYYSAYFDGTGDYLTAPANTAYAFGTGNFTIEAWVFRTADASGAIDCIVTNRDTSFATGQWALYAVGSTVEFDYRTSITQNNTVTASLDYNTWTHVAVVRNGTSYTMYKNGQVAQTKTISALEDIGSASYNIAIGSATNGAFPFSGYLSNSRIVKGTAVYTSAFTPSTAPLTAIANTSLLTCQSSTFIDNSTNKFTITAVGNSQPTTVAPFTVTYSTKQSYTPSVFGGSMYFDGTGDYITATSGTGSALGPSNFTIEFWMYGISSNAAGARMMGKLAGTWGAGRWVIHPRTTAGKVAFQVNNYNSASPMLTSTTSVDGLFSWNHIAIVRLGSVWTMYVNGVAESTVTSSVALDDGTSAYPFVVGSSGTSSELYQGIVCDVRVIKGQAIYTSNFAPQNQPLTPTINTTLLLNGTGAGIYDSSTGNDLETVGDAKLSTAVVKYGNTSMYFDGAGDYVFASSSVVNQSIAFGTGNFTIEFWFNASSNTGTQQLFDTRPSGVSTTSQYVALTYLSGSLNYYTAGANPAISGGAVTAGVWNHVALSRSGTSTKLFVNGTQVGATYTDSQTYLGAVNRPIIASDAFTPGNSPFAGYMSDIRITKGIARYTANFTPPTSSLGNK